MLKIANFWIFKKYFWGIWRPDLTLLTTPDILKMIDIALKHTIVYVTIKTLILCNDCYVQNMFKMVHFM